MASAIKTYIVVSSLPVVVEDSGVAVSYQPGQVFTARENNISVVGLLEDGRITETSGTTSTGATVIQGQQGPVGPTGPTGPSGPPGGLPAALLLDNTTSGTDLEVTDGDAIVAQTDGGWNLGSPDGGSTLLRPGTIYVQGSVVVDGTSYTANSINGASMLTIESGAGQDLFLSGGNGTPASGEDGGTVVLTSGANDGAGANGKIEFRGNFTNALVADIDGALNLYDGSANKVIEVLADPGALRVGRNTHLTAAEGDFVFGNDGSIAGAATGLLVWDANVQQLDLRDTGNLPTIEIDGGVPEVALFEAGAARAAYLAATGGQLMLRAEHAAMRAATDAVFDILIKGGDSAGVEDASDITIDAGRALGTGVDGVIQFRTGNMDRWFFDPNGQLLASTDNGYNVGDVSANRPANVYVGTTVVVAGALTVGANSLTNTGSLSITTVGALNITGGVAPSGAGATATWTFQTGAAAIAGVAPTAGGAGGGVILTGASGGDAQGTGTGGETGGDGGPGGTVRLIGGPGGLGSAGAVDPGQPGPGGPLELFGGPGGNGAGTSDNADGADVIIRGGTAGTGGSGPAAADGDVIIGDTDTTNVVCGSLSVTNTSLVGSITTVNGGVSIAFETGGTGKWDIPTTGHFLAATDNVFDIGASGATRPRTAYLGTSLDVASGAHVLNATQAAFFGQTPTTQQADTVALTDNSGGTADDTIAAITQAANAGSADVGPVADAIADLAAKYNALRDLLRAYGLMA